MSEFKAKPWIRFAVTAGINLLVAVMYFVSKVPLATIGTTSMLEIMRNLSDACMIPGMFTLMMGLLFWVSSLGALDGVGYLVSFIPKTLIPGKRKTIEKYADYVERKVEDRKNRDSGFGFLCIVGASFVILSLVFLGLFYRYY